MSLQNTLESPSQSAESAKAVALWAAAEKAMTLGFHPENARTSGLLAIKNQRWHSALLRLNQAVEGGIHDLQTLDALGEAAYRAQALEVLIPYQGLYKDPLLATHLARAYMGLGEIAAAQEFLKYARESLLKTAIQGLLGMRDDIETCIASVIGAFEKESAMRDLYYPEFWQALSAVADAAGREDLVKLAEQRTKAQAYQSPVIHFNQAMRLLAQGEFRAGWRLYDCRMIPGSPCSLPTELGGLVMWEGQSLKGRSLLVVLDNGLGDQMFGLRFIQSLLNEGARIEIATGPDLLSLVRASFPALKTHLAKETEKAAYWSDKPAPDFWCYSLSVPARAHIFEPVNTGKYLEAPRDLVARYRARLKEENPRGLRVRGIVWHGDIRTPAMRTRAYSVAEFLQCSEILNEPCVIVNLQKDATPGELGELAARVRMAGGHLIDAAPTLTDFAHTAAWISNVDRMYSCDTSCAHAAGALGVPATVLVRNKAIWHWICRQDGRSVWYDSITVKHALVPKHSYMFEIPKR